MTYHFSLGTKQNRKMNGGGGQKLQRGGNKRLFSGCFLWDLMSLKRKGGAERRTSVICELQIERVPLKKDGCKWTLRQFNGSGSWQPDLVMSHLLSAGAGKSGCT